MIQRTFEKRRLILSGAIFLMLFCGFSYVQPAPPIASTAKDRPAAQSPIDPDIAEATFRYQFAHNASGQQTDANVYCIGFGTGSSDSSKPRDPPPDFLSRLGDVTPPVKAYSQCSASADEGVKDKTTGKLGLIFTINSVKYIDNTRCEVEGGYYEAGLSASGNTYFLEKRGGKWVVIKDIMHWIS
jgi:hypothetical protein